MGRMRVKVDLKNVLIMVYKLNTKVKSTSAIDLK